MTDNPRDLLWTQVYTAEKAANRVAGDPTHEANMAVKAYDMRRTATTPATVATAPEALTYEHERAIMEGERNASLTAFNHEDLMTLDEQRLYETAFTNGWNRRGALTATPAAQPAPLGQWERQDLIDAFRTPLELIALGESKNPAKDATDALVNSGFWDADATCAARAQPAAAQGELFTTRHAALNVALERAYRHRGQDGQGSLRELSEAIDAVVALLDAAPAVAAPTVPSLRDLPDWVDLSRAVDSGEELTPLERFVYDNEEAEPVRAAEWRASVIALVQHYAAAPQPPELGQEQNDADLIYAFAGWLVNRDEPITVGGVTGQRDHRPLWKLCAKFLGAPADAEAPAGAGRISNLIAEIRFAKSMAMRDSLFEKLIDAFVSAQAAPADAEAPAGALTRDQIRAVFMQHGFTVKEGQTDLKEYVYDAAYALLGLAPAVQGDAEDGALPAWWDDFIQGVCEISDRNSPEDEPDAIVATPEELAVCAINAIDAVRAQPAEAWPLPGDLVRYSDGSTALALHGEPHAGGWYGVQCMGGYTFYSKVYKPTETDRQTWVDCAVQYRFKSLKEAQREAGLPSDAARAQQEGKSHDH